MSADARFNAFGREIKIYPRKSGDGLRKILIR